MRHRHLLQGKPRRLCLLRALDVPREKLQKSREIRARSPPSPPSDTAIRGAPIPASHVLRCTRKRSLSGRSARESFRGRGGGGTLLEGVSIGGRRRAALPLRLGARGGGGAAAVAAADARDFGAGSPAADGYGAPA